jgi:DNA (cytosine-5)-methyltransferase 1
MVPNRLRGVSLFAGCGGFDWGATQAGVDIIWANDNDEHAAAAYQSVFPKVQFNLDDVRNISVFPKAEVLIGCYPCTGLSVAARRRWKNSPTRNLDELEGNFLYWSFLRALKQIRPRYFFVENVVGMITADNGWFFNEQVTRFSDAGYSVQNEVLNAVDFGVPQTRKRVFIVGVRNDIRDFRYEFPRPTHGLTGLPPRVVLRDVLRKCPKWTDDDLFDGSFHGHYLTRNRKRAWHESSYTIVANAHHVPLHPKGSPMKFVKKDTWVLQGRENRRLSWRECSLLQGLPGTTVPTGTTFDKYRVVGNAVPPAFGEQLLKPVVSYEASR